MSKAQTFLESFNDFTTSDDEIRLRANHKAGIRCLSCGRMLNKVHSLPAVRTCPNGDCGAKYQFSKGQRGSVGVRKV